MENLKTILGFSDTGVAKEYAALVAIRGDAATNFAISAAKPATLPNPA